MRHLLTALVFIAVFSSPVFSQPIQLPTIGEIFDFNVGDEFQTRTEGDWGDSSTMKRLIVLDKEMSSDNQSVEYTMQRSSYYWWDELVSFSGPDTIYVQYNNLDSTLSHYDNIFEQYGSNPDSPFFDTLHYYSSDLCDAEVYRARYSEEYDYDIKEWGIGLGETLDRSGYGPSGSSNNETELVYYVKNGESCGTDRFAILSTEDWNAQNLSVYPTIFEDFINVKSDHIFKLNISIYTIFGQLIFQSVVKGQSVQLQLNQLETGSYLYVIRDNEKNTRLKSGIIVKQ